METLTASEHGGADDGVVNELRVSRRQVIFHQSHACQHCATVERLDEPLHVPDVLRIFPQTPRAQRNQTLNPSPDKTTAYRQLNCSKPVFQDAGYVNLTYFMMGHYELS